MSEFLTIKRINNQFIQPDQKLFSGIEIRGRFGKRTYPDPIDVSFDDGMMKIEKDTYKASSFTKTFAELKALVVKPDQNEGIKSINEGNGIKIDETDPENPVISVDDVLTFEALLLTDLPVYADNAEAISSEAEINTVYKTATGELRIVV